MLTRMGIGSGRVDRSGGGPERDGHRRLVLTQTGVSIRRADGLLTRTGVSIRPADANADGLLTRTGGVQELIAAGADLNVMGHRRLVRTHTGVS